MAIYTIIFLNSTVKFKYLFTSGSLMKSVYILCNYSFASALFFKLCQCIMSFIGFCVLIKHFITVKSVKFLCLSHKKTV